MFEVLVPGLDQGGCGLSTWAITSVRERPKSKPVVEVDTSNTLCVIPASDERLVTKGLFIRAWLYQACVIPGFCACSMNVWISQFCEHNRLGEMLFSFPYEKSVAYPVPLLQ